MHWLVNVKEEKSPMVIVASSFTTKAFSPKRENVVNPISIIRARQVKFKLLATDLGLSADLAFVEILLGISSLS